MLKFPSVCHPSTSRNRKLWGHGRSGGTVWQKGANGSQIFYSTYPRREITGLQTLLSLKGFEFTFPGNAVDILVRAFIIILIITTLLCSQKQKAPRQKRSWQGFGCCLSAEALGWQEVEEKMKVGFQILFTVTILLMDKSKETWRSSFGVLAVLFFSLNNIICRGKWTHVHNQMQKRAWTAPVLYHARLLWLSGHQAKIINCGPDCSEPYGLQRNYGVKEGKVNIYPLTP